MKQYIYSAIAGETVTETETATATATATPTGGVTATATVTQTETETATQTPPPAPPDPGGDCADDPICSGADPDNKDDSGEGSCIDATTCCPTAHFMLYGDGGLLNLDLEPGDPMPVVFTGDEFDLAAFKVIYDGTWADQTSGSVVEHDYYLACSGEEGCGTDKLCRYGVAWRAIIRQGYGNETKWYGQVKWCLIADLCADLCDVSDDFNRANEGSLGAPYVLLNLDQAPTNMTLTGNEVIKPVSYGQQIAALLRIGCSADCWAQIDYSFAVENQNQCAVVAVRVHATNCAPSYLASICGDGRLEIIANTVCGGSSFYIHLASDTGMATSGTLKITAVGTTIKAYIDGVEKLSTVDGVVSGQAGIGFGGWHQAGGTRGIITLDNFDGGDL